ncbi:MAG: hypothetical protein WCR42_02040 [bacterium]
MKFLSLIILLSISFGILSAQESKMQYFRYNDQRSLNIFETSKDDNTQFNGLNVKIGGGFTQNFQALKDENISTVDATKLIPLTNGFNLAMANLNIDVQLADGIRLNVTSYLSSKHHQESWVKAGYIQIDKLLFFNSEFINSVMENLTFRVGDLEVNYGDQHFRRSDGGNSILNPFVENYIMDEFATEIGGEVYYHSNFGLFGMVGVTNGALNPTVVKTAVIDSATKELNYQAPAIYAKLGYDKTFDNDLRIRLSGSYYGCKSALSNTLFGGDRTGSNYFLVMEPTTATTTANAFSGRLNPGFREEVSTIMINPFIKWKGLEFFGTYEMASGRAVTESVTRKATQMAADLIYRFPAEKENFWVGARYNTVTASLQNTVNDVTVTRIAASAGWFITQNLMMKLEYVTQEYKDYPSTSILAGGKFNGFMLSAAVGF